MAEKGQYITLFKSDNGEAVLRDLIRLCHLTGSSFVRAHPDGTPQFLEPIEAAFRDGQRSVLLYILHQLRPEQQAPEQQHLDIEDEFLR